MASSSDKYLVLDILSVSNRGIIGELISFWFCFCSFPKYWVSCTVLPNNPISLLPIFSFWISLFSLLFSFIFCVFCASNWLFWEVLTSSDSFISKRSLYDSFGSIFWKFWNWLDWYSNEPSFGVSYIDPDWINSDCPLFGFSYIEPDCMNCDWGWYWKYENWEL